MSSNKYLVIAISGISCSGKTELTQNLNNKYKKIINIIHMDDFYKKMNDPLLPRLKEYDNKYANWESFDAINVDIFVNEVEKKLNEIQKQNIVQILLVEGIFVLNFEKLKPFLNERIYISLPYEIAKSRREKRVYEFPEPSDYFDNYVWPTSQKYFKELEKETNIVYLDGQHSPDDNLNDVIQIIEKYLK